MLTISADFRAKETLPLTLKLHYLLRILYSTFLTPLVGAWNGIEETFESIHRERTLSSYKNHCRHHRLNFRDCLKKLTSQLLSFLYDFISSLINDLERTKWDPKKKLSISKS